MDRIVRFKDEYSWLSNFYPTLIELDGEKYTTVENAYQASKTLNWNRRKEIQGMKPGEAKRFGKKLLTIPNWDDQKLQIMEKLLIQKFSQSYFHDRLWETKGRELVEGNNWHDNFWGSCFCDRCGNQGKNNLGKLLMKIRDDKEMEEELEEFEIYFRDLTPDTQRRLCESWKTTEKDENWDVFPLATLYRESE